MLGEAYQRMLSTFGPQHWWPSESPLEVIVGAVLTQNTNWKNVESSIENLRDANLLSLHKLYEIEAAELETLIRPAGYFRVKAKRLKNVIEFIVERYRNLETMIEQDCDKLRQELLEVNGVGPETADSILLYAANKPTFVIDAYTARIAKRHGWIEPEADYHALKEFFESQLEKETELFNEYHALIVQVGKDYCKPTPKCDGCPLQPMIADSGLVNFGDH